MTQRVLLLRKGKIDGIESYLLPEATDANVDEYRDVLRASKRPDFTFPRFHVVREDCGASKRHTHIPGPIAAVFSYYNPGFIEQYAVPPYVLEKPKDQPHTLIITYGGRPLLYLIPDTDMRPEWIKLLRDVMMAQKNLGEEKNPTTRSKLYKDEYEQVLELANIFVTTDLSPRSRQYQPVHEYELDFSDFYRGNIGVIGHISEVFIVEAIHNPYYKQR